MATYDLGGGTFDAAVVRLSGDGQFELVGQPDGVERQGGIDFDDAIAQHVVRSAGVGLDSPDITDAPGAAALLVGLRQQCVTAKEALSAETDVTIPAPPTRRLSRGAAHPGRVRRDDVTGSISTYFVRGTTESSDPAIEYVRERLAKWNELDGQERRRIIAMLAALADVANEPERVER